MAKSVKNFGGESDARIVVRALALGGVAGLRAMLAPALFSSKLAQKNPDSAAGKIAEALAEPRVVMTLRALSAGELIGDKLPKTPNRIAPLPLIARAFSGALVGEPCSEPPSAPHGSAQCWAQARRLEPRMAAITCAKHWMRN